MTALKSEKWFHETGCKEVPHSHLTFLKEWKTKGVAASPLADYLRRIAMYGALTREQLEVNPNPDSWNSVIGDERISNWDRGWITNWLEKEGCYRSLLKMLGCHASLSTGDKTKYPLSIHSLTFAILAGGGPGEWANSFQWDNHAECSVAPRGKEQEMKGVLKATQVLFNQFSIAKIPIVSGKTVKTDLGGEVVVVARLNPIKAFKIDKKNYSLLERWQNQVCFGGTLEILKAWMDGTYLELGLAKGQRRVFLSIEPVLDDGNTNCQFRFIGYDVLGDQQELGDQK